MEATQTVNLSAQTIAELSAAVAVRLDGLRVSAEVSPSVPATSVPATVTVASIGGVDGSGLLVLAVLAFVVGGLYLGGVATSWIQKSPRS